MKKAPNSGEPDRDHSLPRTKILRGRRNFERLFKKSTVYHSNSLQLRYRFYDDPAEGCYVGFIAPKKKIKKAVRRNKIKRLMREVYRTHQHILEDIYIKKSFGFHAAFIANREDVTYQDILTDMVPLMNKTRESLLFMSRRKNPDGLDNFNNTI